LRTLKNVWKDGTHAISLPTRHRPATRQAPTFSVRILDGFLWGILHTVAALERDPAIPLNSRRPNGPLGLHPLKMSHGLTVQVLDLPEARQSLRARRIYCGKL
jgi:hypothetical protein